MRADPKLRRDGLCLCGKPRRPERSAKYAGVAAQTDPFCSSTCCRRWHGCALPVTKSGQHMVKEAA